MNVTFFVDCTTATKSSVADSASSWTGGPGVILADRGGHHLIVGAVDFLAYYGPMLPVGVVHAEDAPMIDRSAEFAAAWKSDDDRIDRMRKDLDDAKAASARLAEKAASK